MPEIPCKEITQKIIDSLKSKPAPKKILAAVLIGENPASISFLKQKEKIAKELGVDFRIYNFNDSPEKKLTDDKLRQEVGRIANQKPVGGIIIQLPLPKQFNGQYILNTIPPEKDVDVLGERALGAFYAGRGKVLPPAVGVIEEIIVYCGLRIADLRITVIGSGSLIGKPISIWLERKTAELIILNSKTKNIKEKLKDSDIIISGAGKTNLFSAEDVKENAVIIDFGYNPIEMSSEHGVMSKKINGDFDYSSLNTQNSSLSYTPTPGGTGPILVAKIIENFYKLNAL
ncbi:MAG: bifunctional 5,10-methylenetetrahydrofolate dehydrogenase/5,10-methenyltetrahydrofolate cyclohydrolase [Spirochaetia bacterium]|nr:MAG: bifunctional 5,10-methylenetetrahydrofolate dehydrogenase/5,10-methenyltetrahydrofolate cyclohydrolase [Spirochaetia bacterium]